MKIVEALAGFENDWKFNLGNYGIVKLTDCGLYSAFLHEAKPLKLRRAAIDNMPRYRSESG